MAEFVAAITFRERSRTRDAYPGVRLGAERWGIVALSIVDRDRSGTVVAGGIDEIGRGAAQVSLVGALVAALSEPLGMLLGLDAGPADGTDADSDALSRLARTVPEHGSAIVVQTAEENPDVLDEGLARLGASIRREDLAQVVAELESLRDAQVQAARAARAVMVERRGLPLDQDLRERIDALRGRFPARR